MLIKGVADPEQFGRTAFAVDGKNIRVNHFVTRTATKEHPFEPHKHEQEELWFILEGQGIAFEDGHEFEVTKGDLINTKPWVEHGLRTDDKVIFICLG